MRSLPKQVEALCQIVNTPQRLVGKEVWDVFILLDDVVQKLTKSADERLAWQAQFPI